MTNNQAKAIKDNSWINRGSFLDRNFYPIVIFCFSFLLFANTLNHNYNLDDELVTKNHKLTSQGLKAIPEIFTSPYYSDNSGYSYEYRPIVHVSFAIEHQFLGESPHVSHFINAILYACLCVLLFMVLFSLFGGANIFYCFFVTLIFAAHPVHTEAVASIKNRDELLALFFSLAAWYFVLKYASHRFLLSLVSGFLMLSIALLTKLSVFGFVAIIPFSLVLIRKSSLRKTILLTMVLFIPAFVLVQLVDVKLKVELLLFLLTTVYFMHVILLFIQNSQTAGWSYISWERYKNFFSTKVFPFNQPLFVPFLYIMLPVLMVATVFNFLQTWNRWPLLIMTGLCFVASFRAKGFYKWLLLLAFHLSLWTMRKILYEPFTFIIFLNWCYFSLAYLHKPVLADRLLYGSLLLVSALMSLVMDPTELDAYLLGFFISLIPLTRVVVKKARKLPQYIVGFMLTGWSVGTMFNYLDGELPPGYPPYILPIFLLYLLFVYYPGKITINQKNLSRGFLIIYIVFSGFVPSNLRLPSNSSTPSIPTGKKSLNQVHNADTTYVIKEDTLSAKKFIDRVTSSSVTDKPEQPFIAILPANQNRPLDFVENPIAYTDPMAVKLASALDVTYRYLKLLVLPYPLAFYYGYAEIKPVSFSDTNVVISIIIHSLLVFMMIYFFQNNKLMPFFGMLIYFCTIAQFTNIYQAVPGMMGERYLLGPSIGFCMVLAYVLIRVLKLERAATLKDVSNTARYVLAVPLSVYSLLTIARNNDWKDDYTLFSTDIQHVSQSAQAHNLLALNLKSQIAVATVDVNQQQRILEEAALHFKKALEIYPEFFNAAYDLGRLYLDLNKPDSAIFYYKHALRIDSSYNSIRFTLANVLFANLRYREALPYLTQMVEVNPMDYQSYDKLSFAYFKLGEFDKSLNVNRLAAKRMPNLLDPIVNIGRTYQGMGKNDSARFYFRKVISFDSTNMAVKNLLKEVEKK